MSKHPVIPWLTVLAALLVASDARGQCTAETAWGKRAVLEFATSTVRPRPTNVPLVQPSQVRLLTNATDAATCQRLHQAMVGQLRDPTKLPAGRRWTFYQVGDFFYIVMAPDESATGQRRGDTIRVYLGYTPILVINRSFQHVITVGR